jgi:hypothetical protein
MGGVDSQSPTNRQQGSSKLPLSPGFSGMLINKVSKLARVGFKSNPMLFN